jgi:hypothetical protein
MVEKQWIDDTFCVEQKPYGLWDSYDKEGKCIVTSLHEHQCIEATRFILKVRQEEANGTVFDVKTYSTKDNYKL